MSRETLFARANGVTLAYDTFGDPDGVPLLLVMGLGTQMIAWDEAFCEGLVARGYRVVRFDNRDIGLSTKFDQAGVPNIRKVLLRSLLSPLLGPPRVPYMLADMAADAVGLLDALGIDRAHIVGASMGGAIAQEVALRFPHRVRTLVSIMATSGAPGLPAPTRAALEVLTTPAPTGRAAYIERYLRVMRVLRARADAAEEALDPVRAERAFDRGVNPGGAARQLAAIIASGSRGRRLRQLRTPTLVIHGDIDPLVRIECGADVARRVPGAKMVTIAGMGHVLPRADWPRIIDAIAEHAV